MQAVIYSFRSNCLHNGLTVFKIQTSDLSAINLIELHLACLTAENILHQVGIDLSYCTQSLAIISHLQSWFVFRMDFRCKIFYNFSK